MRNIAAVIEREREKPGVGKVEFAALCGIKAPTFLQIPAEGANPRIDSITRISISLSVSIHERLYNDGDGRIRAAKVRGAT